MQRYDEPGEKTRYFADDDGQDLESLVKRQRYEGAEDIDANLAENIARKATYKWVPSDYHRVIWQRLLPAGCTHHWACLTSLA